MVRKSKKSKIKGVFKRRPTAKIFPTKINLFGDGSVITTEKHDHKLYQTANLLQGDAAKDTFISTIKSK